MSHTVMHGFKHSQRRALNDAAVPDRAVPNRAVTARDRSSIRLARFKIDFVNRFIRANAVPNLLEFGCSGGRTMRQLRVATYIGVESSLPAMQLAQQAAASDPSRVIYQTLPPGIGAALALSMDTINRLTGGAEFNAYTRTMFQAARDYVLIFAVDQVSGWNEASLSMDMAPTGGVSSHARLTGHIRRFFPGWDLAAQLPAPYTVRTAATGRADFFVYARQGANCVIPLMAPL